MAVAPYTTVSTPRVYSPPSVSTKIYAGLKLQSQRPFGASSISSNVNAQFFGKVNKVLNFRHANQKSVRAQIHMMPIGTPRVAYRTPGEGTYQWIDLWNALYRERVIFIGQQIDEEFSNQILATMLYLDTVDNSEKLYLYINGPGGDLTPCMALYDTMQSLKTPIATHCLGQAYNLAAFLLAAGEKGYRTAMPLARVAIQSPAGAARGRADDIQNEANELLRIRDYLFNELASKTGHPVEKIAEDLKRIKHFDAQEALDYGLIDKIVRPQRIKADAPRKDAGSGIG
jgi:ATP-dependent Clp protease protease subunit